MLKIHAHILAWNESETIHLTVNHYKSICEKITIYDNYSDDNTPQICTDLGCNVVQFGIKGELNDGEYLKVKNHCWKGSDADYVIVCDADEILYHHDLKFLIRQSRAVGATIFKTHGVNMISNEAPRETWLDVQTGVEDKSYSKLIIFDPQALSEIGYIYGCHEAKPQGRLAWGQERLNLLHYRCVGGVERLIERHKLYKSRLSQLNKRWKLGNYDYNLDEKRAEFADMLGRSQTLSALGIT